MAGKTDVLLGLVPSRVKPTVQADGSTAGIYGRSSRYGDQTVVGLLTTKHGLADEGSYFTAQNPTIGTGVALDAAKTAFADTNGLFVLRNSAPAGSGIRVYLDYLKLILTAATTAIASVDFLFKGDSIVRSPSTAANGTAMTPVNVNMDDATSAVLAPIGFNNNVMTLPAASGSARVLGRAHAATGLGFAGDSIIVQFGASERSSTMGLTAVRAVGACQTVCDAPPIVIGPQQTVVIHRWSLTEAAAVSYEFELGWWER